MLSATEKSLRVSEMRYRRLFESAQDGILLLNATSAEIEDVNPFLIDMLGYSREELMGRKIWEIGAFKDTALSKEAFIELQTRRFIRYDNLPLVAKNGTQISVEFVSNAYDCAGIEVIQCNIRDNTRRHLAEIALRSTTRTLKMLSDSNVALLGAKTESFLLLEYCRIAVETGGYLMAWIGHANDGPDKDITVLASFGHEAGLLGNSRMTWAEDDDRGNTPTGRAFRTGMIEIVEDISTDISMAPWQSEALSRGYFSSIAVPFSLPDATLACMTLYSPKKDFWSSPERKLLQEMASDLAFGIKTLRTTILNIQYQTSLRESLEQTIQTISATIKCEMHIQQDIKDACQESARELPLN